MLSIEPEEFSKIYEGLKVLDNRDIFYNKPVDTTELTKRHMRSKLWRLNNLYTIVDKYGESIKFVMNRAQHIVYSASLRHPRLIILKSRQQGISTLWLIAFFDDCIFNKNFTSGLMAQGEDEAATLLTRTRVLWDNLNPAVKRMLGIDLYKKNTKEFSFTNGSSMVIRTSFRSATLQRLHISEFGKIANRTPQRARETKTGTLQAIAQGNIAVIESTAEGDNDFKHMWDNAMAYAGDITAKDFLPVFLSWVDDLDCVLSRKQEIGAMAAKYFEGIEMELNRKLTNEQKYFWVAQQRELGSDVYQEYPATPEEAFLRNRDGTYYANLYLRLVRHRNREMDDLHDPKLPTHVAVDLGRNDYFVLVFYQIHTDGVRIINCYKNTGQGIRHYCEVMDSMKDQYQYDIDTIVLPHDAEVRDLTSDETREEAFWKFGYNKTRIVERTKDINNDRELVRQMMERLYVDKRAQYIIDCFLNYTKEWDARRNVWKDLHEHNDHSHGADAIRQLVRGTPEYVEPQRQRTRLSSI